MIKRSPLGSKKYALCAAGIYGFIVSCRNWWYGNIPGAVKKGSTKYTVSVGAIHAGGTGKTPLVHRIAELYQQAGYTVSLISRGYGRKTGKRIIVPPHTSCTWREVGDEPAFFKKSFAGAWLGIDKNRVSCMRDLDYRLPNRTVYICDDAFQHQSLHRDLNIACLPAHPFDENLLPAGYLREPLSSLERADILCLIGSHQEKELLSANRSLLKNKFKNKKLFILYQQPLGWIHFKTGVFSQRPPLKNPILLSGIARPERFKKSVEDLNVIYCNVINYEDHHAYTIHDIFSIDSNESDGILTTEKDSIKLSEINWVNCPDIWYLKIRLSFFETSEEKEFFSCFRI